MFNVFSEHVVEGFDNRFYERNIQALVLLKWYNVVIDIIVREK